MCTECGCETPPLSEGLRITPRPHAVANDPFRLAPAGRKRIVLEHQLLSRNRNTATENRERFTRLGIRAINLLSSPGAGKTSLLECSLKMLGEISDGPEVLVIEGDQQTQLDADRIRACGTRTVQINTGHGCHLDAAMVQKALDDLHEASSKDLADQDLNQTLLFIENVGNLVCPALWDLGEESKVVLLSVAEGDDKPLKYPDMFAAADLILINKVDLTPYTNFSMERALQNCRAINPNALILPVSATRGDGMHAWIHWLIHPSAVQAGSPTVDDPGHEPETHRAGETARAPVSHSH